MNELIAIAAMVLVGFVVHQARQERKELIEAIMAKSLPELREKPSKKGIPGDAPLPDLMPIETTSNEAFDLAIKKELGRETVVEKAKEKLRKMVKHG